MLIIILTESKITREIALYVGLGAGITLIMFTEMKENLPTKGGTIPLASILDYVSGKGEPGSNFHPSFSVSWLWVQCA